MKPTLNATTMLVVVCFLGSSLCHAVDRTWNGSFYTDWFDANNWYPVGVPGSNDTAIINSGDVFLDSATTVAGLTLTGGTVRGNGGGHGSITITTNFTWTGGTLGWPGTNTVSAGATLTISGSDDKVFAGHVLNNYGAATWSGSGSIHSSVAGGSAPNIINNFSGAAFEAQSSASIYRVSFADPVLVFNNAGTLRKTGVGTANTLDTVFNNTGTVELFSGTLKPATINNTGTVTVLDGTLNADVFNNNGTARVQGGALEIGGGTSTGLFDVQAAGALNFFGIGSAHNLVGETFTNLGSIVISGGNLIFQTAIMVPGAVTFNDGNLAGTNEVTFQSLTWTGGTMSGGGVTTIAPGGTLAISGSNEKVFVNRTLNNNGTATWSGTGRILSTGGFVFNTINNAAGAAFEALSSALMDFQNSGDLVLQFYNSGTFRKSGAATTSTLVSQFYNTGLLEVQTGSLDIGYLYNFSAAQAQGGILRAGDGFSDGRYDVSAGASLEFGGTHTLLTNSVIAGEGDLRLCCGYPIALNGTNLITGTIEVLAGTVDFNSSQSFGSSNAPLVISGGTANINVNVARPSVALSGGEIGGTNELTIPNGGVLTWTDGGMGGNGVTTISPGATLAISGSGDKVMSGRAINNGGMATWSGVGRIRSSGGFANIIKNLSGAIFEAQSTAVAERNNSSDPTLVFENAGTFRKTGAGTTTTFAPPATVFNNTGTMELLSGNLHLADLDLRSDGTLRFLVSGPTAGVGYGQLEASHAVVDGSFNVSLTNGFRPTGCDTFKVMKFGNKTGSFLNTNGLNLGGDLSFIMSFSDTDLTLITAAPQPCLGLLVSLTNGQFQFQITGRVGSNYLVQASTDLTAWIPIGTNLIPANGNIPFTDPFATNFSRRFYRAVLP